MIAKAIQPFMELQCRWPDPSLARFNMAYFRRSSREASIWKERTSVREDREFAMSRRSSTSVEGHRHFANSISTV